MPDVVQQASAIACQAKVLDDICSGWESRIEAKTISNVQNEKVFIQPGNCTDVLINQCKNAISKSIQSLGQIQPIETKTASWIRPLPQVQVPTPMSVRLERP